VTLAAHNPPARYDALTDLEPLYIVPQCNDLPGPLMAWYVGEGPVAFPHPGIGTQITGTDTTRMDSDQHLIIRGDPGPICLFDPQVSHAIQLSGFHLLRQRRHEHLPFYDYGGAEDSTRHREWEVSWHLPLDKFRNP
jgi:hypothetical protein